MEQELETLVVSMGGRHEDFLRQCETVQDWGAVFALAFEHGVAGVLFHHIESVGFAVPEEAGGVAERQLATDRLWHRRITADLQRVLSAFDEVGLRVVSLKGPLLSERLYPEAALRASGDLDLLVHPTDLASARHVLESIGYGLRPGAQPRHAMVFDHPRAVTVDLHHRASGSFGTTLEAESLLAQSIPYRTATAQTAWILSPEDEFLYLAVHAARHRFLRLRWLYDLLLFIRSHDDLFWETVGQRARSQKVERAVAVTCHVLEKRLRFTFPSPARECLYQQPIRSNITARIASWSAVDPTGIWRKSYGVFWHVSYQALLGNGMIARASFWCGSLLAAAAKARVRIAR